jgi:uncharacterized membrane protein (UPF0127 family)
MKFRLRFLLWLFPLFLVSAAFAGCDGPRKLKTISLDLAGTEFTVEVADTQETRARGLMFRASMPETAGMLFVFDRDAQQNFWMENTDIPLSLAYISRAGEIREIFDMTPRSRRAVPSTFSVRYALEVNQGVFQKLGIGPGSMIVIPPLP